MTSGPASRLLASAGLSLIELMVGLAVAGTVAGLGYKAFLSFNLQAVTQKRIAASQGELVPITETLDKNLRRAGYRIPPKAGRRVSPSVTDSISAVTLSDNGTGPDGITVRGNFSGVVSQLRNPCAANAANLELTTGTAGGFEPGDAVVIDDGEFSEYVAVSSVSAGTSALAVPRRLRDYPAGSSVTKVSTVEFRPDSTTLSLLKDGAAFHLSRSLQNLRFYFVMSDESVDSVPPFTLTNLKWVQYRVKLRIPKAKGGGFLYRETTGRVMMRNLP